MYPFFVALHILLCLFLILIIMLQPGKGGDVGAAFGGGSSTIFGPRGPTGLLQRATTIVAVLFMCTTITLALYSNRGMMNNANVDDELLRLQEQERLKKEQAPATPSPEGLAPAVPSEEIAPAPPPAGQLP
jgi:preprotein translocase subunit SecG